MLLPTIPTIPPCQSLSTTCHQSAQCPKEQSCRAIVIKWYLVFVIWKGIASWSFTAHIPNLIISGKFKDASGKTAFMITLNGPS